jgi:hypothetical protein
MRALAVDPTRGGQGFFCNLKVAGSACVQSATKHRALGSSEDLDPRGGRFVLVLDRYIL